MTALTDAPSKPKLYYGWRVLSVTMVIAFFSCVMAQLFAGAMLPHVEADTGWSRSSITLSVTLGSMVAGFASPLFGRLADRRGPRLLTTAGLMLTTVSLLAMGLSASISIGVYYLAYVSGRAISQNTLSGVVARTTAVNWFRRMRGRALGLTGMAVPFGAAVMIPLAQLLISAGVSWQETYYLYAILMLALVPLALLVLRHKPEDIGLLPDGATVAAAAEERRARPDEYNFTLKEAMRTRALWLLIAAMSIGVCAQGAIGFHMFAYYKDQGISGGVAALTLSVYALCGATANGLWGYIVERVSERLIGAATVSAAGLLCIFLLLVDTPMEALIFAIAFGFMARGEGSIIVAMEANYFGRGSFGVISGFASPFQQVALGVGPIIAALSYDATDQSYTAAFVAFAVMFIASAGLIWSAKKPPLPAGAMIEPSSQA
ncbi:MAG: MFS transporter [Dehalococcoidia bacterium]|nr:MFS transporter [Dehalococcoidia bacterium]